MNEDPAHLRLLLSLWLLLLPLPPDGILWHGDRLVLAYGVLARAFP